MAQVLVGYDEDGNIRNFDRDGSLSSGTKLTECVFVNLARLITKDEIQKESFIFSYATGTFNSALPVQSDFLPAALGTISDYGANTAGVGYKTNSPAGEYAILYTSSATPNTESGVGLLYYQAGIAVLTASVFDGTFGAPTQTTSYQSINTALTGTEISAACNGFRARVNNLQFNNTTELNSTIYFCRAGTSDFNYSANPSYLTGSKIRVKNEEADTPISFVTGIGLYSADNELLAVAKLSEPLKKDPTNELTLRVRLDY